MTVTVDFYRQSQYGAIEVDDIWTNAVLPAEFKPQNLVLPKP